MNEEVNNLRNMVFITFVPKEDTIEKFYVSGHDQLKWYLEWTLDAMEKCIKYFKRNINCFNVDEQII